MELVSIIIPMYNAKLYIEECLESIHNQTYDCFECIIINDGSTDGGEVLAKRYVKLDERFTIIDVKNQGVSFARNIGLEKAVGKYIIFVDCDDLLERNYLFYMVQEIEKQRVDILFSDNTLLKENGQRLLSFEYQKRKNICNQNLSYAGLLESGWLNCCWGKLYFRDAIRGLKFPTGLQLGEDTVYILSCVSNCTIGVCMNNGYIYRETGAGLAAKCDRNTVKYLNFYHKILIDFVDKHSVEDVMIKNAAAIKISKERLKTMLNLAEQNINLTILKSSLDLLFQNRKINRMFRLGCCQDVNPLIIRILSHFPISKIWLLFLMVVRRR